MNIWRKRRDRDSNKFADDNVFMHVWDRRPLPDPGSQNWAFESLALYPTTPVGPGIGQISYLRPLAPQVYALQAVRLVGIPITSGQIYGQPLIDASKFNLGG